MIAYHVIWRIVQSAPVEGRWCARGALEEALSRNRAGPVEERNLLACTVGERDRLRNTAKDVVAMVGKIALPVPRPFDHN